MTIVGIPSYHQLIFLVIIAPCLVKAYCESKYRTTYGNYNCAGQTDGTRCCYKNAQGYCNNTVCINGAIGTCMFHKCVTDTNNKRGGGCKTVAKTGKTGCLSKENIACIGKNIWDACTLTYGGIKEGYCGNISTPVTESEVLGCGSKTTCYGCLHGAEGACWNKPIGAPCRTYRTYTSASYSCGRGMCEAGWTTYTGGTCTSKYFPYCSGNTGVFAPDNPSSNTSSDGNSTFYLILIGMALVSAMMSSRGIRSIIEVRTFVDRVKSLLTSADDKVVVEGKILEKKITVHSNNNNTNMNSNNGSSNNTKTVTYEVKYEFQITSDNGEVKNVTNSKCVLKESYDKLPEANSLVNVVYSISDANFNFTEIDARVETSSQGRYLFGYIFIAGGLGTLIVTLVFSDSVFSFGVTNAATIQTGVIISIIVYVVINVGVGVATWKGMISAGNMLTKYAAGKSTITLKRNDFDKKVGSMEIQSTI